jgi:hypothetical protein
MEIKKERKYYLQFYQNFSTFTTFLDHAERKSRNFVDKSGSMYFWHRKSIFSISIFSNCSSPAVPRRLHNISYSSSTTTSTAQRYFIGSWNLARTNCLSMKSFSQSDQATKILEA